MSAISPERAVSILDTALQFQRYRRVAVESLTTSGAITLPTSLSSNIDSALQALSRDPNWIEIGRQLALLKTSKAFKNVYLRRDRFDIEVVVVHWWGGGPLALPNIEAQRNAVWDIIRSLNPIIGEFSLSDNQKGHIDNIVAQIEPQISALGWQYTLALSILKAALALHESKQGPTGVLLNLALGGLSNESRVAISATFNSLSRKDNWSLSAIVPSLWVTAWDVPAKKVIGHTMPNSLNVSQLESNIDFVLSQ